MKSPTSFNDEAYCSINDVVHVLPGPGSKVGSVLVNNQGVLPVPGGYLLDALQLMEVKVSQHEYVQLAAYASEKLVMLTLKLETVEFGVEFGTNTLDVGRLKPKLTSKHVGTLMVEGQLVYFGHNEIRTFSF
ncbi:unnamed protein product [Calypogeia fissa]